MNRELFVVGRTEIFVSGMREQTTVAHIEQFMSVIEDRVHECSRTYTAYCRDNELALTHHAAHIRMVVEKIRRLRNELLPILKKRVDFGTHLCAVREMGFISAECEAMENLIV